MQRVMITGGPGSGKSTLARIMGERTGLPVHHMDRIHWKAGWVQRDTAERLDMAHAVEASKTWVFEGGLSKTYDNRASRADTLIWLDLPLALRFWRVIWRTIRTYGKPRPDLPEGCPEQFDFQTLEFWHWIWSTRHSHRTRLYRVMADHPHLIVHHLRSRSQVTRFIANLPIK